LTKLGASLYLEHVTTCWITRAWSRVSKVGLHKRVKMMQYIMIYFMNK